MPIVSPGDIALQKRVLRAFWVKSQINEIFNPESMYRFLAIQVLEISAEKGYDVTRLESACKRFERLKQFGDRIDIAGFFDNDTDELQPYSWYLEQLSNGMKSTNFDAYIVPGATKPMWRTHDGSKIDSLRCVVFAGVSVDSPVLVEPVQIEQKSDRTELEQLQYDFSLKCLEVEQVKIERLQWKQKYERLKKSIDDGESTEKRAFDIFGRFEGMREIIEGVINDDANFTYSKALQKKAKEQHKKAVKSA